MPQPPSPNMALVSPTPGSDPGTWGTILNTLHDIVDAHTHKAGSGVKIGATAIQWDADITAAFAGVAYALLGVRAVDFTPEPEADVAALSSACFANSDDANNLYYRNSAGQNVQITDGATLAITASGGFGGDYTAVGASAGFTDAADTYFFKQQLGGGVNQYARIQSADVDLYEFKAHPTAGVPTNRVRLASPASLGASYSLIMPAGLPASTKALYLTSTGEVNPFSGDETLNLPPAAGQSHPSTGWNALGGSAWVSQAAARTLAFPIDLHAGTRIKSIVFWYIRSGGTLTFELRRTELSTNTPTVVSTTTSAAGTTYTSITLTPNHTMLASDAYQVIITAGGATDELHFVQVIYDIP
jgi:hypothetical protein